MKKYFCNPVNVEYKYQFNQPMQQGGIQIAREAADPSMILYEGKYYIFASMTLGVWVSSDMAEWENHKLPDNLPLYDYAPDVRVMGDYVYFCASKKSEVCDYYRTKDVMNGPYEKIEGTFPFWDPGMYLDDDGRVYFYWGCSSMEPMWGVELDPVTFKPISEKVEVINGRPDIYGYERCGEDHSIVPLTDEEIDVRYLEMLRMNNLKDEELDPGMKLMIRGYVSKRPFIEGAWMNKYNGKYYLQYACTGTQYNVYGDGVYEADSPLGPYTLAKNNPYSYKPGGFLPGAGHGSTMEDLHGNYWHSATMRISMNHDFERRVGIWPAGFDKDGELFCNQRFGDWPMEVEQDIMDPWKNPQWFLLSLGKKMTSSSMVEGKGPELAVDENVQTWWQAAGSESGEWIMMDLLKEMDVRAVQINFADDKMDIPVPGEIRGTTQARYIDEGSHVTRWVLEGALEDGEFFIIEDKSSVGTNLPHDLVVRENGLSVRYLRLTIKEVPFEQNPCISGLRVFGIGNGKKPAKPTFKVVRESGLDMMVSIEKQEDAVGYNILWGHQADKLYHSCMTFEPEKKIGALIDGQRVFVRVDAFNENGLTEGTEVLEIN